MDFRAVYATALKKWLGISSESFLGQQPEIDFLARAAIPFQLGA